MAIILKKKPSGNFWEGLKGFAKEFTHDFTLTYIEDFLDELGIDAFRYIVENDLSLWEELKKKVEPDKAKQYLAFLSQGSIDYYLSLITEARPQFVEVLKKNPSWLGKEIERLNKDLTVKGGQ